MLKDTDNLKVQDAPPLPTPPQSPPLLGFTLRGLPSINDILYLPPLARAGVMKRERTRGYTNGLFWGQGRGLNPVSLPYKNKRVVRFKTPVISVPVFAFARVWRVWAKTGDPSRSDRTRDVYNPYIKGFVDGLVDANIFSDDSEAYHRDVWLSYAGTDITERVELYFYEAEEA